MKTLQVTFEVETNMSAAAIKDVLNYLIQAGELPLENRMEDIAEIDEDTVTVTERT